MSKSKPNLAQTRIAREMINLLIEDLGPEGFLSLVKSSIFVHESLGNLTFTAETGEKERKRKLRAALTKVVEASKGFVWKSDLV